MTSHRFPVRVYYEDTDLAGIVYYANYLKFIERARSEWVREIGVDQRAMKEQRIVFAVRRVEAELSLVDLSDLSKLDMSSLVDLSDLSKLDMSSQTSTSA